MPANPASALGEAAGKLFENAVIGVLERVIGAYGYTVQPQRLVNGTGNTYQIDAVISDSEGRPVIIVDPKYIRYTKHNRDKASWLCTAHYNLRKSHPTLRKSIAVLGGRWSAPSIALMQSFGVETISVTFEHFCEVFDKASIQFDWHESDREVPAESLKAFLDLSTQQQSEIAQSLIRPVEEQLSESVESVLRLDATVAPHLVSGVEILIKTELNEMVMFQEQSISAAIARLLRLMPDDVDVASLTRNRGSTRDSS